MPSALIGPPAPATAAGTLGDLPPLDLAGLADGELKLVNFWASWCAPCRVEHPHLEALAAEGLPIYGVNYKDDPAKALAFLDELGSPYRAVGTRPRTAGSRSTGASTACPRRSWSTATG